MFLAQVLLQEGDHAEAREQAAAAVAIARDLGDRRWECITNDILGNASWCLGRLDEAREQGETAVAISREIGDRETEASAITSICSLSSG